MKMGNKLLLSFLITGTALLGFSACSQSDTPNSVSSNVMKVKTAGISTRANEKTSWVAGDEIGIFVTGTGYTPAVTDYKTSDGSTWSAVSAPIYLSGQNASVYAAYPFATAQTISTLTSGGTFAVSAPVSDDFQADGATDYMWGTGTSVNNAASGNTTTITMNHVMAKLTFVIVKDANYPAGTSIGKISNITIGTGANKDIVTSGTTQVGNGLFSATTSDNVSSLSYVPSDGTASINEAGVSAVTAYMLVCPNTSFTSGEVSFSLTIDGKTMIVSGLPTASPISWVGGNNYTYTITVSPAGLAIATPVIITPWIPRGSSSLTAN